MGKEKSATSAYRPPTAEHHVDQTLIHRILPSTDPKIPTAGSSCHGCRAGNQWDVNSEGELVVSLSYCPRDQVAGKRKREPEQPGTSEPEQPTQKQPKQLAAPLLGAARELVIQRLVQEVREKGLFTPEPSTGFLFFLPKFEKKKDGTWGVEEFVLKEGTRRTFPLAVSWLPASKTNGLGALYCGCKCDTCYHVPVLERLLAPLDNGKQPAHGRLRFEDADGGRLKRAAVEFKEAVPGVRYVAVQWKKKWVVCGTNGELWFCSRCRDWGGSKLACRHIQWAQGKEAVVPTQEPLYPDSPGDPDRGWAAIEPEETTLYPPGEETALVCKLKQCKLEHPRCLSHHNFTPCSTTPKHSELELETVHMCTEDCSSRPCMKGPGEVLAAECGITTGGRGELLDQSRRGYFSQSPPAYGPPCKSEWRRMVEPNFAVLNEKDLAHVDFCTWRCQEGCHTLRPLRRDEVYYDNHVGLMATYGVLKEAKEQLLEGRSFQKIWNGNAKKGTNRLDGKDC
jgi:hypothetical protein